MSLKQLLPLALATSLGACSSIDQNPYFTAQGVEYRNNVLYVSCLKGIEDTRHSLSRLEWQQFLLRSKESVVDKNASVEKIEAANEIVKSLIKQLETLYGATSPEVLACKEEKPKRN